MANSKMVPEIWSDDIIKSYKRNLKLRSGFTPSGVPVDVTGTYLLEGSVVRGDGQLDEDMLLLGYDASRPYGERALLVRGWREDSFPQYFEYHTAILLTDTGRDALELAAHLIPQCGEKLWSIRS